MFALISKLQRSSSVIRWLLIQCYCANCIGNEYARALITVNENASPGAEMFCEALLAVFTPNCINKFCV